MHTLKVFLGFIEVAASLKFLSNTDVAWTLEALPRELFLVLWTAILLVAGLYLLGMFRMKDEEHHGIGGLRLVFGLLTIGLGSYFFLGALGYKLDKFTDALAPPYSAPRIGGNGGGGGPAQDEKAWTLVADDLEGGLARARADGKRALLNFTGVT
jgi:thiol:disulfide interchange protein DsbD